MTLTNEDPHANWRKKLLFRSWHRGTREMDFVTGRFADQHIHSFSVDELQDYEQLLNENDPDLYNWITGRDSPPADRMSGVLQRLIDHHR